MPPPLVLKVVSAIAWSHLWVLVLVLLVPRTTATILGTMATSSIVRALSTTILVRLSTASSKLCLELIQFRYGGERHPDISQTLHRCGHPSFSRGFEGWSSLSITLREPNLAPHPTKAVL